MGTEHLHTQEGPAADGLPAALEETLSALEAATVLHCSHQVCPVPVNHCLLRSHHQARQNQTEDCRVHS